MKLKAIVCLGAMISFGLASADKSNDQPNAPTIPLTPQTKSAVKFDLSLPLRLMIPKPIASEGKRGGSIIDPGPTSNDEQAAFSTDQVLQSELGILPGPSLQTSFNALSNLSGSLPPDPAGDVGQDHYVVMTNLFFQIWNKDGTSAFGPAANNTIWTGFGGNCESDNAGDPIVLYDQIADRWLLSLFTSPSNPQFYNCLAVSQTSDPTGSWYRWAILNNNGSADLFPDYPKYGI